MQSVTIPLSWPGHSPYLLTGAANSFVFRALLPTLQVLLVRAVILKLTKRGDAHQRETLANLVTPIAMPDFALPDRENGSLRPP